MLAEAEMLPLKPGFCDSLLRGWKNGLRGRRLENACKLVEGGLKPASSVCESSPQARGQRETPGLLPSDSGLAWCFPTAILGWGQGRGLVRAPQEPVPHPGRNGVAGTQETRLALKGGEDLSGCVCPQKGARGLLEGGERGKPGGTVRKPHLVWNQRCQRLGSYHSSFSFEGLSARNASPRRDL